MLGWFTETTLVAAVLASLALGVGRSRRLSCEARHAVWLVVLVKFLLPPVLAWPRATVAPEPAPPPTAPVAVAPDRPPVIAPAPAPPGPPSAAPVGPPPAPDAEPTAVAADPAPPDAVAGREPDPTPAPDLVPEVDPEPIAPVAATIPPAPAGADPVPPPVAARPDPVPTPPAAVEPAPPGRVDRSGLILAAWLAGSAVVLGRALVRIARFRRVLGRGIAAPAALVAEVARVAGRVGVAVPPTTVVAGIGSPLVWCLGRPRLILPDGLERLTPDARSSLIAHELAHLARGDHWVARGELLAGLVWWWNPVFRLARRRVRELAEAACDARVVRAFPDRRFAYAEALVAACERFRVAPPIPALGIGAPRAARSLEARLTMILRDPARPPGRWLRPAALALVALSLPTWTQARQAPAPPSDPAAVPALPTPKPAPPASAIPTPGDPPPPASAIPSPPLPAPAPAHPIVAAGTPVPPTDPEAAASWTIAEIRRGFGERPWPDRFLAFRHTATTRVVSESPGGRIVGGVVDPNGVRVDAADLILARQVAEELRRRDPHKFLPGGNDLGLKLRVDRLTTVPTVLDGSTLVFDSPGRAWWRWFCASELATSVALRTNADTTGPVPIWWEGRPLDRGPTPTDDLSPRFYLNGPPLATNSVRLRVRPEYLIDATGPMALLFRGSTDPQVPTVTPALQLAGAEQIDGVAVARVAWLANDPAGTHGLAWVAPGLGYAVVRFEATGGDAQNGQRTTWRRDSSGFRKYGDLWLPDRVEYRSETRRTGDDVMVRSSELVATFEDYRLDVDPPADAFAPRLTIGGLDPKSGAFTAEAPAVPDGLADRLKQAIAASPFGPPRIEPTAPNPGAGFGGDPAPRSAAPTSALAPATPMPAAAAGMALDRPGTAAPRPAPATERPSATTPADPKRTALDDAVQEAAQRLQKATTSARNPKDDPAVRTAKKRLMEADAARTNYLEGTSAEEKATQALIARVSSELERERLMMEIERKMQEAAGEAPRGVSPGPDAVVVSSVPLAPPARPAERAPVAVLQARRDAQAAEVARAEATRDRAAKDSDRARALMARHAIGQEEFDQKDYGRKVAEADLDRERARLAEADALLDQARGNPTTTGTAATDGNPTPPRTLADLRDLAELLQLQAQGKQADVDSAQARVNQAQIELTNTKKLSARNGVSQDEVSLYQAKLAAALGELAARRNDLEQVKLRHRQTEARVEAEKVRLGRLAERARARRDWSRSMQAKGYASAASAAADATAYDDLMTQIDPSYKPEAEPQIPPESPAGPDPAPIPN